MDGTKKVLIVEDEPMLRNLYQRALTYADYATAVARNADETYEKLTRFKPDYIILDVMLPGKSGLELLQELRTDPQYGCQEVKIIILTNLAQHSVADNAMEHGADAYIIKADILPIDLPEIIQSLDNA
jgi:DNA-binding response OmpR family regulator